MLLGRRFYDRQASFDDLRNAVLQPGLHDSMRLDTVPASTLASYFGDNVGKLAFPAMQLHAMAKVVFPLCNGDYTTFASTVAYLAEAMFKKGQSPEWPDTFANDYLIPWFNELNV